MRISLKKKNMNMFICIVVYSLERKKIYHFYLSAYCVLLLYYTLYCSPLSIFTKVHLAKKKNRLVLLLLVW